MLPAPIALLFLTVACGTPEPPATVRVPVIDTLHGAVIVDDYRWLEDQSTSETKAWLAEQSRYADRIVADSTLRAALEARLRELADQFDLNSRIAKWLPEKHHTMRPPGWETKAVFQEKETANSLEFRLVVNPIDFRADGTTSVFHLDSLADPELLLYGVRDGGREEFSIRVRDVATGQDLVDSLPASLYGEVRFNDTGTGFYYSDWSGARVRLHMLGTEVTNDTVVFGEELGLSPGSAFTYGFFDSYRLYIVPDGNFRTDVYLRSLDRQGELSPILRASGVLQIQAHDHETKTPSLLAVTDLDAPKSRLLRLNLDELEPPTWREVISETDDTLTNILAYRDRLYAHYLRNVQSRIARYDFGGARTGAIDVPEHHVASLCCIHGEEALLRLESIIHPPHARVIDLETLSTKSTVSSEVPFNSEDFELSQVWYTTPDGARFPMYLAHRRGLEPSGDTPTLLTAYGAHGFADPALPRFRYRAAVWIEQGGVYALASVRGGGELGSDWARAGLKKGKAQVVEDFVAAAQWLVDSGHTNPSRLAVAGRSSGGWLIASALTKRPDLFAAASVGSAPVDFVRWNARSPLLERVVHDEWGDPANGEEFELVRTLSPLHSIRDGVEYPAVLVMHGGLDTKIPPDGALKMVARLQAATASDAPVILYYDPRWGHVGGETFGTEMRRVAMEMAFLWEQTAPGERG